jgi:hypothetical protein
VLDDVLRAYDAAWNESDQAARSQLLERSLTEDAERFDPTSDAWPPSRTYVSAVTMRSR